MTRRGFFTALAGAVAAPLALKLFPKRESTIRHTADIWKHNTAFEEMNQMLDQWTKTPFIFHPHAFAFVMKPWPWNEPLDFGNERTVTIQNPDGTTKSVTINQTERGNS